MDAVADHFVAWNAVAANVVTWIAVDVNVVAGNFIAWNAVAKNYAVGIVVTILKILKHCLVRKKKNTSKSTNVDTKFFYLLKQLLGLKVSRVFKNNSKFVI